MKIEYEATFENIDKDDMKGRLRKAGAKLVRPEALEKRLTFDLPKGNEIKGAWLRVRDTGSKKTLALKIIDGDGIENQKEIETDIADFEVAVELLEKIGCRRKSYQETKREQWMLDGVEISIDEWPFLEPYVEVEGKSEKDVKDVSEKLGFDYGKAFFGCVSTAYSKKYGVPEHVINFDIPKIIFDMDNPFLNMKPE